MNCVILLAIIGLVGVVAPVKAKEIEVMSTFYTKEEIGGVEFVYREEMANGTVCKSWTIDGKEVKPARYLDALLDAEKEVRRTQRIAQEQNRIDELNAKLKTQIAAHKKVLQLKVANIEQWLAKLYKNNLLTYLAFSPQTYDTQESFDRLKQSVSEAHILLAASNDDETLATCERLATQIDDAPQRLRDLFYATMDNAIQMCGDTKVLKDLLEIVCQA